MWCVVDEVHGVDKVLGLWESVQWRFICGRPNDVIVCVDGLPLPRWRARTSNIGKSLCDESIDSPPRSTPASSATP